MENDTTMHTVTHCPVLIIGVHEIFWKYFYVLGKPNSQQSIITKYIAFVIGIIYSNYKKVSIRPT